MTIPPSKVVTTEQKKGILLSFDAFTSGKRGREFRYTSPCISASTRQRPPGAEWPRRTRTTTGSASSTLCPRRSTLSYRDSGDRHAAPLRPSLVGEVPEEAADGGLLLLLPLPSARQHPGRGVLRRGPEERAEDAQVVFLLTPTYFPI